LSPAYLRDTAESGLCDAYVKVLLQLLEHSYSVEVPTNVRRETHAFSKVPNTPDAAFLYLIYSTERQAAEDWIFHTMMALTEHCSFITSTQHIGRGPNSMEIGDLVAWLAGSDTAMILRAVGQNYNLIGAAYIYGIPEKDIWETREDVTQQEIFVLE
jgi:hypothetical protein